MSSRYYAPLFTNLRHYVLFSFAVLALVGSVVVITNSAHQTAGAVSTATAGGGASLCYGDVAISQENADAVAIINQFTNQVTTTLGVQPTPNGQVFSGDGRMLFVSSFNDSSIMIIDTATDSTVRTLSLTGSPMAMVSNFDGSILWVEVIDNGTYVLLKLNTTTGAAIASQVLQTSSYEIFLSPDESTLWSIASILYIEVIQINANTLSVISSTNTGGYPYGASMSRDGSRIYLADYSGSGILSFNTANLTLSTIGSVPSLRDVEVSPDGTTLYAIGGSSYLNYTLYTLNAATGQSTTGLNLATLGNNAPAYGLVLTADGSKLYVTYVNYANGGVGVVETSNTLTGVYIPMEVYVPVAVCPLAADPAPPTTTVPADPVAPTFTA